jgi:predicted transposase/invertase (TIGR01784 family)
MSITKFLDPKNDVAFRKIFGTNKNKDILIHFLNDMLSFKQRKPIVNVTFLKTIQDPEAASKKTSVVDVLCEDKIGNTYVVEMQVAQHKGFEKRAQYYAAKAYTNQMGKGGKYVNLKEVIFIAIANFTMFPDKPAYKSDHVIFDKENQQHDLKDFSFTFLELPKFTKEKNDLTTMIEKWSYYFKHAEETTDEDLRQIFDKDTIILKAYDELDRFHWKEEELRAYEAVVKNEMDYQASLDFRFDAGKREGKAEGRLEIARNLKKKGLDVSLISETTGLMPTEIEKL